jgi:putative methionine-R-sulfoxide reductase with GAF domain/CHASE3 domain sensor protein
MTLVAEAKLVEAKRFGFWGNLPLSRKLLLAFGMLFVFGLIIAGLGVWGLNRVQSAYENALAGGVEIQALSDHLNSEQLEARRREKDFLLRWQTEGYDLAYENYVVTNQEHTLEMKTTLNKLKALAPVLSRVHLDQYSQAQFEADLAALNEGARTYEKSFAQTVRLLGERGFVDTGLEGEVRSSVHAIEEKVLGVEDQLTITMLQIRRHEKDYLLRGDQQYVDGVHEQVAQLKNQTANSDTLTFSEQVEIRALAEQYLIQFDGLVAKDREAAEAIEVFRAAAADIQTITERLKLAGAQLAAQDVETAQANNTQTFTLTLVVTLLVLLLSIALALVLSRQITLPVLQLTNSARAITAGTFDIQAQVSSGDEVGTLAQTFNTMTRKLGEAFEDVRRRAAELATVAEVSTATSTILESKRLLQEVVDLTKERFQLYHSHIYLLDENGENLVLAAGAGEPGRFMVAEGRLIPLDWEQSLVARAARERKGVTVNDVTTAADFLPNPLLPDTRSELAVPMIVGGRVIGVFDIQSEQVGRFTDSDVNIQTTLAAQLATSIQNVRSFEQSRKQAELESLVNVIGQKIQRTTSIEETLQTAIRELGTAVGAARVKAHISTQNDGMSS